MTKLHQGHSSPKLADENLQGMLNVNINER